MSTSTHAAVSPDSGTHWTEPGAWPAAPGVLRLPLPLPNDGLRAVNVYVLEDDDGLTLIDGGWTLEASRAVLLASLKGAGLALGDVRRFLVTHAHRDHYTQAVALRGETGASVLIGREEQPSFERMHARSTDDSAQVPILIDAGAPELARKWAKAWATAPVDLSEWELPDAWLEDQQVLDVGDRSLTAVSTPGHTRGHYVFADLADRMLFAGDHVLPTITPSIGLEPSPTPLPLGDFLASLTRVRELPDCRLLPAHGPITDSSHARIDELLTHHDERLELCRSAVASAGVTAHDVALTLPWTRHARRLEELDSFNAGLAVLETRAHLEVLVRRGGLVRDETGGVAFYTRPAPPTT
jgi:glyoxylase-like metal-dependent hydrolase (beta-lactamase superfamily II)